MTDNSLPNALKHGAFSEILILPGEDPQDFEKLKNELFAEYKPSGVSEERVMLAIARAFWQERRLVLFQYVQHARARKTTVDSDGGYGLEQKPPRFPGQDRPDHRTIRSAGRSPHHRRRARQRSTARTWPSPHARSLREGIGCGIQAAIQDRSLVQTLFSNESDETNSGPG